MWPRLDVHPQRHPRLLFADIHGRIFEHPKLLALGLTGLDLVLPTPEDFIPLPQGSALYVLPDRYPIGLDPQREEVEIVYENPFEEGQPAYAVAAYLAPAHTQTFLAPYQEGRESLPPLPLFSYACVGWWKGRFWVTAFRSDFDHRQEVRFFDEKKIVQAAEKKIKAYPRNRLVRHLVENCVLRYRCPAARNFVLGRWEAPIPTSPVCNARCLGCLSWQGQDGPHVAQERLEFIPSPEEIAEAMVPHLKRAPRAIVSFGQGCEGEPLLQGALLAQAIRLLRSSTNQGTINLNTNASLPEVVTQLGRVGLDSMRVSLVSARPRYYEAYFRPKGYGLDDVKMSIRRFKSLGGFVSLNLFIFPGITDEEEEAEALEEVVSYGVDFIQLRNHAIDPIWYLGRINYQSAGNRLGIKGLLKRLAQRFPRLRFGYFNPPLR